MKGGRMNRSEKKKGTPSTSSSVAPLNLHLQQPLHQKQSKAFQGKKKGGGTKKKRRTRKRETKKRRQNGREAKRKEWHPSFFLEFQRQAQERLHPATPVDQVSFSLGLSIFGSVRFWTKKNNQTDFFFSF